jgi:hypothetical protein
MRRALRPPVLAMVALIAMISAGCGSNAPSETGDAHTKVTDRDKAVKFAECIRAHGVSDFPDPDASNEFEYGVSVTPAVWTKVVDACKDLQPPGSLSAERNPEQEKEALTFARCVREHGIRDFPDPIDGEPLINTYRIPSSGTDGGMTVLNAAIQKCRDPLAKAAAGR